ncbi:hypothetical protein BG015_006235 [Linnemannia schmuckeri]|uniref:F-box domain-containing protein n=1 Tax=Linnemannia schmuckeri TaxID=64567 RepID=A0A9P5S3I2_9FUNG|nr:hypothetical protein BG015_006235 [Linnemannia schmuckeri]
MTPSSCHWVFDLPELLELLLSRLGRTDLSRLSRTNQTMHARCSPSLFQDINEYDAAKIFASIPSTMAFGRNTPHVRKLALGPDELAYYYDCVQVFEEFKMQTLDTHSGLRQSWLSPPDSSACQLVALPPITRLSQFSMCSYTGLINSFKMRSSRDSRASLLRLCWLLSLNLHLTRLSVTYIDIVDVRSCHLLANTIIGLDSIKDLYLEIGCKGQIGYQLGKDLLHRLRPTIRRFRFKPYDLWFGDPGLNGDADDDLVLAPRRQRPLINLMDLHLLNIREQTSKADLFSIFKCCPNIEQLSISGFISHLNVETIGEFIGKECPKLWRLGCERGDMGSSGSLSYYIMKALPPQQVTNLRDIGLHSDLSHPAAIPAIHQHSTTLREIIIGRYNGSSRMASTVIFDTCINLERLKMYIGGGGVYMDLADAQGSFWRCTKLRSLSLNMSGCELPPVGAEDLPYYERPTPIAFSQTETDHFAQLERFYIQIGRLAELRELSLTMDKFDGDDEIDEIWPGMLMSFPAMLSLGNTLEGRPGYLGHLAGLTKLKYLWVRVDAEETKRTVGWKEVTWMSEHWPGLGCTELFEDKTDTTAPFAWLQNQRMHSRLVLTMA